MLRRKITKELESWKSDPGRKSLVVQGARQVGKTYSIRQFGKSSAYEDFIEINFKETPSAVDIFSGDLNVDSLLMALRFRFPEKRLTPEKTLIFLDEIQECPEAITSLKFWSQDQRYDVIASGSLLEIDYKRASSYPVGYVDFVKMQALDFEEFLWNYGIKEDLISTLRESFESRRKMPDSVHRQMMEIFRFYVAVGGMPEVVDVFLGTKDFSSVDRIQRSILTGYQYDIAHYATAEEKIKAEKCFLSLGKQLLDKENHKFQYKEVEKGGRAQKYFSSVEWLEHADMASVCRRVTAMEYDLNDYARNDFFRLYVTDLSLLMAMRDFSLKQQIVENTVSGNTKGGIYEAVIADMLSKKGYELFFYKNETTRKELDFLIQKEGKVIPVEVKSANARANTLNDMLRKHPAFGGAYKLIDGNIGVSENGVISAPLYMTMFL